VIWPIYDFKNRLLPHFHVLFCLSHNRAYCLYLRPS